MNNLERVISIIAIIGLILIIGLFSLFVFFPGNSLKIPSFSEIFKGNEEKIYQKIRVSFDLGDYQKAFQSIEDYLSEYPSGKYLPDVYIKTASIYYAGNEYQKAKLYVEKALSLRDLNSKNYIHGVEVLGKISMAEEAYDPVATHYLENAYPIADISVKGNLAVYLGFQYYYKRDYSQALTFFSSSGSELAPIGRARVYIENGKYPEAIQEYLNYFAVYPKGNYTEGVKTAFIKQTLYYSGKLIESKNWDKAEEYLLNTVTLFPRADSADDVFIKLSDISREKKDFPESESYLNKALANSITNGDEKALYQKALLYYDWGKKSASLELFRRLEEQYPDGNFGKKAPEWIEVLTKDLQYE